MSLDMLKHLGERMALALLARLIKIYPHLRWIIYSIMDELTLMLLSRELRM